MSKSCFFNFFVRGLMQPVIPGLAHLFDLNNYFKKQLNIRNTGTTVAVRG